MILRRKRVVEIGAQQKEVGCLDAEVRFDLCRLKRERRVEINIMTQGDLRLRRINFREKTKPVALVQAGFQKSFIRSEPDSGIFRNMLNLIGRR